MCVLISGILVPVLGTATAQDSDDPLLPAAYHGEVQITDGTLSESVLVEVVAGGEVQDSIMSDEGGQFGGPTISDEKLEVQPDYDEVTFRVGGVDLKTIPFESETQEVTLNATQEELAPFFTTSEVESNSPVEGGEEVTVTATIENEGALSDTQNISLVNASGDTVDSTAVSLSYNESTTASLSFETDGDTSIDETYTVESADSEASVAIEVERVTPPEIAPPPSQGGGGGGAGGTGGGTTGANTSDPDADINAPAVPEDVEALYTERQSVVSDAELNLSQVRFSESAPVVSITWNSAAVSGEVFTTRLNDTPAETGSAPGTVISASQITVPEEVTNDSATIQFRENTTQIAELGAAAEDLEAYRYANDEWRQVDAAVVDESNESIVLQAETPGFSYFAVTDGTGSANTTDTTNESAGDSGEDSETNDGVPGFGTVMALVALMSAALLIARRD
jgi:PGF-pre-PGF domain-containing protein/PGF-CTERM protein